MPPPSAEAQLAFLAKLQRLFSEGNFTATYKFALLIALADLAVEIGADDGAALPLSNQQIAERFVQLYWQHASPYTVGPTGVETGLLIRNFGSQAAVITAIADFRQSNNVHTLVQARALSQYSSLLIKVAATVSAQPLTYLQNFGGGTDQFLYERNGRGSILLKPGVVYCLRRFYPLVQHLSRTHWVEHIKSNKLNQIILGKSRNLEDFLLSTSRQSLLLIAEGLRKLDGDRCFYCNHRLNETDVDHFIPFSLYPRDLAHNFVLAHPKCNRSKSDTLAARPHLERWLERLVRCSDDLTELGFSVGVNADSATSKHVTAWGYSSALEAGGKAWLDSAKYEAITCEYLELFYPRPHPDTWR